MARAHITAAPMAAPCATRAHTSAGMLGASTQAMDASTYSAMPASKIGRRPNRSDSGPHTSCEVPNASSRAAKVSCTSAIGARKSACSAGSAGR